VSIIKLAFVPVVAIVATVCIAAPASAVEQGTLTAVNGTPARSQLGGSAVTAHAGRGLEPAGRAGVQNDVTCIRYIEDRGYGHIATVTSACIFAHENPDDQTFCYQSLKWIGVPPLTAGFACALAKIP
jgi:hypothetical protein